MKPVPKEGILDMPAYVGGRDAIKGIANPYKMSANENPLGASPAALAALEKPLTLQFTLTDTQPLCARRLPS